MCNAGLILENLMQKEKGDTKWTHMRVCRDYVLQGPR